MTSLTCTSRQARTHRLHWMQASRLTAMAGWLRSGAGCARSRGKRLALDLLALGLFQNSESGSSRRRAVGLVGQQQFGHHPARGLGALGRGLHLHAGRGLRMQVAASTRSPSTSTMQTRQLPSGR